MARLLGDSVRAGDLYYQRGKLEAAARMYARAGRFDQAARVAKEAGDREGAVEYLLEGEHHLEAGELLSAMGRRKEAIRQFERARDWTQAGEESLELGLFERAARYFEKAGLAGRAGACYEEAGQLEDAIRCFERESRRLEGQFRGQPDEKIREKRREVDLRLAKLHERIGDLEEAATLHAEWGDHRRAGDLLKRGGNREGALQAYLRAEDWSRAMPLLEEDSEIDPRERAKIYRSGRRYEEAGKVYSELGDNAEAAECFEAVEDWSRAAKHWERTAEVERAGELYYRDNRWREAARCFTTARRYESAAQAFRQIPDPASAAACYLELDRHLEAARLFLEAEEPKRAAQALQKIPAESPDFSRATLLLVPLLIEDELHEAALHRLRLLPEETTGTGGLALDRHYWEGRVLESQGRIDEARRSYERALALNRDHRDVAERIARMPSSGTPRPGSVGADTAPMQAMTEEERRELQVGDTLVGRYDLQAVLGRGGMGRVYRARDRELSEIVAVKTLLSSAAFGSSDQERLLREVQIARRITHPNVVRVYDLGRFDGGIFVTMEYLEGRTLDKVLEEEGPLELHRLRNVLHQLLAGLEPAHQLKIVHRDLKPSNVHLGPGGHVKLLDFGIARMEGTEVDLTLKNEVLGSPKYMSPEQIRGDSLDGRSDIYSMGVVAYTLLAGREPFRGKNPSTIAAKQLRDEPPSIVQFRADLPSAWEEFLARCLEKDREKRFADVAEAREALIDLPDSPRLVTS